MLTVRLTRRGKKNQPFFRVVVIDKRRSSKGGRAVEVLGFVDPLTKKKSIKKERVLYWLSKGAQPSATVHNLLIQEKITEGKKIAKKSKKSKASPAPTASAPAIEAPATPESASTDNPVEPAPAEAPKEEVKPAEEPKTQEAPAEAPKP